MSEEKVLPVPTVVELKQEELTFGVNEAVEVLSTMYETKRQIRLDSERTALDTVADATDTLINDLKDAIDTSEFNHTSEVLGISSRVKDVEVRIGKTIEDSSIRIILMLTDLDITGDRYTPEFGKFRVLPMTDHAEMFEVIEASNKTLADAQKAYDKINTKLNNVSEIRRQLRAKVMAVKLTNAGLGDVLIDEEVLEIIEV